MDSLVALLVARSVSFRFETIETRETANTGLSSTALAHGLSRGADDQDGFFDGIGVFLPRPAGVRLARILMGPGKGCCASTISNSVGSGCFPCRSNFNNSERRTAFDPFNPGTGSVAIQ